VCHVQPDQNLHVAGQVSRVPGGLTAWPRCARCPHEETAAAYLPQAGRFQRIRIGTILPRMTQRDRSILLMVLGVAIVVIIYAAAYLPH
jgi:hypothetical protein